MNEATLTIVCVADSAREADEMNARLRNAGLHPAELGVTKPMAIGEPAPGFPVEVPAEEATRARVLLSK